MPNRKSEIGNRKSRRRFLPAGLVLPWVALVAAAVVIGVGLSVQTERYSTPFAFAEAYRLLVGAELFGILVLAPLATRRRPAGPGVLVLRGVLLPVIAAPAVVSAAWVADSDAASVAGSQAYLLVAACFVAGYCRVDARRRHEAWYWLLVLGLGGGAPMLAFVAGDLFRAPFVWLYALSPFWVADRLAQPWRFAWHWAVPSAALLLLAPALLAWPRTRSTAL